jgi:hypothetical protein
MHSFGSISPKDYTIHSIDTSSPLSWRLVSSSLGTEVVEPEELVGAVTITRASNDRANFFNKAVESPINIETDVYEYVLYSSIKQKFYTNNLFISGNIPVTESIIGLPDNFYVVSIGQEFYGQGLKEGSFELILGGDDIIKDDLYGNLFVSQSGTGSYIGNIFYDYGIAVIKHDTGSLETSISNDGIKIIENTEIDVSYKTNYKLYRHELNVRLTPNDFNFSVANPSLWRTFETDGSVSKSREELDEEFSDLNIPTDSDGNYKIYRLMQAGVIKPYVTTIGLYSDRYELLAVAKLSTPIQRTFDADQIFIVRFDV